MPKCYAEHLGDCEGKIEDEHFIPKTLQRMFGVVDLGGLSWQRGSVKKMAPGTYAHARMICRRHHDQLDGFDGVALAYFRNFMLLAGQKHISTGALGRIQEITPVLNGRVLEKWFMKTICGAIAAKTVEGISQVPHRWIEGLFSKNPWPEEWAVYVSLGKWVVQPGDAAFKIEFHWGPNRVLYGLALRAYSIETIFSIEPLDLVRNPDLIRRPPALGAAIQRPNGGDILEGLPANKGVIIQMTWD